MPSTAQYQALLLNNKAGGSAFTPASLPGLVGWWDAAQSALYQDSGRTTLATANNDPVGSWSDLSGNGWHANQSTAGSRPSLATAQINGFPALSFATSTGYLATANFGSALNQPNTIVAVAKMPSTAGTVGILDGLNGGNRNAFFASSGPTGKISLYAGSAVVNSSTFATGNWDVYSAQFNGASTLSWQNGSQILSANPGTANVAGLTLGNTNALNVGLIGYLAAVYAYAGALTSTQLDALWSYIYTRFGITGALL